MRACGIDPSLSAFTIASGGCPPSVGILDTRLEHVPAPPPATSLEGRIARYEALGEAAAERLICLRPELVLIEGYSYNSRGSVVQLGECGGLVRRAILDAAGRGFGTSRFRVLEIAPAMLKRFATGKGNAKKAAVGSALAARYGQTFQSDDEADAYALLRLALVVLGAAPMTAAERDVSFDVRAALEGRTRPKKPKKKAAGAAAED